METELRPWGYFTILDEGPGYKVKRLVIDPGGILSLQCHEHRDEDWVCVEGAPMVQHGDTSHTLHKGGHARIPRRCKHRLSNPTAYPAIIIEVQTGTYFGEDDITRYEDLYGRE